MHQTDDLLDGLRIKVHKFLTESTHLCTKTECEAVVANQALLLRPSAGVPTDPSAARGPKFAWPQKHVLTCSQGLEQMQWGGEIFAHGSLGTTFHHHITKL